MPDQKKTYQKLFEETYARAATADDLTELLNRIYNTPQTGTKALVKVNHTDLDVLVEGVLDDPEMSEEKVRGAILQLYEKKETSIVQHEIGAIHPSPWRKLMPYATALLGFLGGVTITGTIAELDLKGSGVSANPTADLETIMDSPTRGEVLNARSAYLEDYLINFLKDKGVSLSLSHTMFYREFNNRYHEASGISGIHLTSGKRDYLGIGLSNREGYFAYFVYDCNPSFIEEEILKDAKPFLALAADGEKLTEVNFDLGLVKEKHYNVLSTFLTENGENAVKISNFRTDYTGTSGLDGYKDQALKVLEAFKELYR